MTQEERMDDRMKRRVERLEREKEKQNLKHQKKVEETDWFAKLNKGEKHGENSKCTNSCGRTETH